MIFNPVISGGGGCKIEVVTFEGAGLSGGVAEFPLTTMSVNEVTRIFCEGQIYQGDYPTHARYSERNDSKKTTVTWHRNNATKTYDCQLTADVDNNTITMSNVPTTDPYPSVQRIVMYCIADSNDSEKIFV